MTYSARREFEIASFADGDGAQVAALHRLALPNGFLSSLGDHALSLLYQGIARQRGATVIVARTPRGEVLGFVSGTTDVSGLYRGVLRRSGLRLGLAMMRSAYHPSTIRKVWETLTYPLRFRGSVACGSSQEPDPGCTAELLSIAVDGGKRGLGIGRALLHALDQHFRFVGQVGRYRVVTDAEDPRSNAFYARMGFEPIGGFLHHGHPMNMYVRRLDSETESGSRTTL